MSFPPVETNRSLASLSKAPFFCKDLSAKTQTKLSRELSKPHAAIDLVGIWEQLLIRADHLKRLDRFDYEVLSRWDPSFFSELPTVEKLSRIFSSHQQNVDLFLQLATTHRIEYYTKETFTSLVNKVVRLVDKIQSHPFNETSQEVSCYDQGGKTWLKSCLKTHKKINKSSNKVVTVSLEKITLPLSFRNFYTKMICELKKISQRLPMETYIEIGELLKENQAKGIFQEFDSIHLFQILIQLTTGHDEGVETNGSEKAFIHWCQTVKQSFGDKVFMFISSPKSYQTQATLTDALLLLQYLVRLGNLSSTTQSNLSDFYDSRLNLKEVANRLDAEIKIKEQQEYPEKDLQTVFEEFLSTQPEPPSLTEKQLLDMKNDCEKIFELGLQMRQQGILQLNQLLQAIRSDMQHKRPTKKQKLELIAIAKEGIRLKFGISPYNTQVMALLGILSYPHQLKGRIAQVKTGEGKSTIIAMLAFYNACLGYTVDVISSSWYLSKRDQQKYEELYRDFGISSSHICTSNPTKDHFRGQILFGTNYDFEFAFIRDHLYDEGLRTMQVDKVVTKRPFQVVIVDEVDNLFIDSSLNSARMSVSETKKIRWIYPPILAFVREHKQQISSEKSKGCRKLVDRLRHHLALYQGGEYLSNIEAIIDEKLTILIKSAYKALFDLRLDEDYVIIPIEKADASEKRYEKQVVIVDKENTGRLFEGCRRGGGIHEFLEAKHSIAIQDESLVAASLCHPLFFDNYTQIYGLTGTLGSKSERKEVEKIYRVDSFDVPSHRISQQKILDPKLLLSQGEHFKAILSDIHEMRRCARPTLVILETIRQTDQLGEFLRERSIPFQLFNERQAENEEIVIARAGAPGAVTVATNTAGRGTDIILHPSSLGGGGLHLILGYCPEKERVDMQAYGRAGRQGQLGTARKIVNWDALLSNLKKGKMEISDILRLRDEHCDKMSQNRIASIEMEKIKYKYLDSFLNLLDQWHLEINSEFIEQFHEKLLDLQKEYFVPPQHPFKKEEEELSLMFINILDNPSSKPQGLKQFLESLRENLRTKILLNWATRFYSQLDEIDRTTRDNGQDFMKIYKEDVKQLHHSNRKEWEQFLLSPKEGFLHYFTYLTGKLESLEINDLDELIHQASIEYNQEHYESARESFENARKNFEKTYQAKANISQPLVLAKIDSGLGSTYYHLNQFKDAIGYLKRSLPSYANQYGENHIHTALIYNNIGMSLYHLGEYEEALEMLEKARPIYLKEYGEKDPKVGVIYDCMGAAYFSLSKFQEAVESFKKAEIVFEDERKVVEIYTDLGLALYGNGQYQEALDYYKKALDIHQKDDKLTSTAAAACYDSIGGTYLKQNDHKNAIEYFKKAEKIYVQTFGIENPKLIEIYNDLGLTNYALGEYKEAIVYCKKKLEIYSNDDDIQAADTHDNMGSAYYQLKKYKEAASCFKEAIVIYGKNNCQITSCLLSFIESIKHTQVSAEQIRSVYTVCLEKLDEDHILMQKLKRSLPNKIGIFS